jgi:membrane associated rhomboid family serine protease
LIPLRDLNPSRRFPIVNYTIMILCGLGFFTELSAGAGLEDLFSIHGLVPARFLDLAQRSGLYDPALYLPFITSTFLHAGLLHFLGNMLFLWIFGDNVEDRMGHVGYALFYVTGGVAAGVAHVVANPESMIPTVGASGSIAAVMGAYLLLYPRAKVVSLVVIVPAVVYLAVWFGLQILSGSAAQAAAPGQGGVAWWAHAGGFVFGVAIVALLGLRTRRTRKER